MKDDTGGIVTLHKDGVTNHQPDIQEERAQKHKAMQKANINPHDLGSAFYRLNGILVSLDCVASAMQDGAIEEQPALDYLTGNLREELDKIRLVLGFPLPDY